MRVKMLETAPGSPDGVTVLEYEQGKEYEVTQALGDVFVKQEYATLVVPEVEPEVVPEPVDVKKSAGPQENK